MRLFLLILLFLAIIIAGPLLVIWALNTLFSLGIPFNGWTWIAVVIMVSAVRAKVEVSGK